MYGKIEIDGRELELAANAATPFRYKQVFHHDLFAILGNEEKAEAQGVEAVSRLTFIMNRQAEKADMNRLTEEEFMTWLEDFGPMAFIEHAEEIMNVYMGSTVSTATP